MVKVHAISGFLGAGKTTLIKHLASALIENNKKVVILENEFGKVAIDGKLLEIEGLSVFEISSGCLCCTLKSDFVTTLIQIADNIQPDIILIEPSGIFVLSEIDDVFKNADVSARLTLCSAITVVDGINFLRQKDSYGYFFENQIRYANTLILSKTKGMERDVQINILMELQKLNGHADILSGEWTGMSQGDFLNLLEPAENRVGGYSSKPPTRCAANLRLQNGGIHSRHFAFRRKITFRRPVHKKAGALPLAGAGAVNSNKHGNHDFIAFGLFPQMAFSQAELKKILFCFRQGNFGKVIRAKGFVLSADCCMLEFHYVEGSFEINSTQQQTAPAACFIGEHLDREGIKKLFKA